jgi:hypothetical protein
VGSHIIGYGTVLEKATSLVRRTINKDPSWSESCYKSIETTISHEASHAPLSANIII